MIASFFDFLSLYLGVIESARKKVLVNLYRGITWIHDHTRLPVRLPLFALQISRSAGHWRLLPVIHTDVFDRPTVVIHPLSTSLPSQSLPGVPGYEFLSGRDHEADGRLAKLKNRSTQALEKLCGVLNSHTEKGGLSIEIGQHAVRWRSGTSQNDNSEMYTELGIVHRNGFFSSHLFNSSCSDIKPKHLSGLGSQIESIDINSGVCLFSKSALGISLAQSFPVAQAEELTIPPIPNHVQPTVYELETVSRLSSAIADVVAMASDRHSDLPIRVNLDVPDFQYYLSTFELLQRGLVTVEYAMDWVASIEKRQRQLQNLFRSTILACIVDRDPHHESVDVRITTGTEVAAKLIKERMQSGSSLDLQELMEALRTEGKDASCWTKFLDGLTPAQAPKSMEDVGRLSYVLKTLKPVLSGHDQSPHSGVRLVIQVDDVTERRILDQAKAFLKSFSKNSDAQKQEALLVGLFPLSIILMAGPERSDLYDMCPSSGLVMERGKQPMGPLELIRIASGTRVKERLRRLCVEQKLVG